MTGICGAAPEQLGVVDGPPGGGALGNFAPGGSALVGTGVATAGAAPEQDCPGGGTCCAGWAAAGAAPEHVCTGGGPLNCAGGAAKGAAPEQVCTGGGAKVGGGAFLVVASRRRSNSFLQTTHRPM